MRGRARPTTRWAGPLVWAVAPAVAVFAAAVVELLVETDLEHRPVAALCLPFIVAPIAWRRRAPIAAALTSGVFFITQTAFGVPANGQIATTLVVLVQSYAIGRYASARRSRWGLTALLAAGGVTEIIHGAAPADYVFVSMFVVASWLAGSAVARRAEVADQMVSRAAFVEANADQRALEAVEDERRRIARELHDLVAHAITVMVLQAGAAEAVLTVKPERAHDALTTIQGVGRGALVDMKRLLGLLRESSTVSGLAPQPTLRDLGALVEQLGAAGLPVTLSTAGDLTTCPDSVATSAFQVVREALTNTLRHAGPASAQVLVRCDGRALDLEVLDNGHGPGGRDPGYGLVGMRERVAAFGGQLQAGALPQGGFGVHARFPFGEPAVR